MLTEGERKLRLGLGAGDWDPYGGLSVCSQGTPGEGAREQSLVQRPTYEQTDMHE